MDIIEIIFELGINLLETFLVIDFLTRYLGSRFKGIKKQTSFGVAWIIDFLEITIVNYITIFETFGTYIPIIIYFMYAMLCLKGSWSLKLCVSILTQATLSLIAIGTNLLVCNVIGYDPVDVITVFNHVRIITVILSKIILFYVTRIVIKAKYKNPLKIQSLVMLVIIPLISIISLCSLMVAVMHTNEIKTYVLIGMGGIVIADIVTYYFFTVMSKNYDAKLKIEMLEQQNENALESMKNSESFVSEMRSVKHDIKNHLLTLYNYIDENQNDSAKEYIKGLTENYLPNIQKFVDTENKAFDALVNSKMAICHQKNIHIDIKPEKNCMTKIDESDIIVLFGNLLDNAIEAAEKNGGQAY